MVWKTVWLITPPLHSPTKPRCPREPWGAAAAASGLDTAADLSGRFPRALREAGQDQACPSVCSQADGAARFSPHHWSHAGSRAAPHLGAAAPGQHPAMPPQQPWQHPPLHRHPCRNPGTSTAPGAQLTRPPLQPSPTLPGPHPAKPSAHR